MNEYLKYKLLLIKIFIIIGNVNWFVDINVLIIILVEFVVFGKYFIRVGYVFEFKNEFVILVIKVNINVIVIFGFIRILLKNNI